MREGRVEQVGTPAQIYREPASAYVFDFIGRANVLTGAVRGQRFEAHGLQFAADGVSDGTTRLYLRPHDLALADADAGFPAQVRAQHRLADRITLELAVAGQERVRELDLVDRPDLQAPTIGSEVHVQALRYRVFPA